jgi:hypothetical protein
MATGGERRAGRLPVAVRAARWILYGLLLLCAVLTLFGLPELQRAVSAGRWPTIALGLPPALLAIFIGGYAAYRLALARAGRYPAGKALAQVGIMVLVLGIVVGIALRPIERGGEQGPVGLDRPLASADPEVRALAAEVVAHRPRAEALRHVDRLVQMLDDPSPRVRRQAHAALVLLAGTDAGGEGPGAATRWRAHFGAERGHTP